MLVAAVAPSTKVVPDLFPLSLRAIPRGTKRTVPALSAALRLRCVRALASCKVTIIATQTRRKAMTTNCIKFTSDDIETAKGIGSISTLTFDLDITVEPVASSNPMAPTHRVLGRSPRGKLVECGGIWKKQNKDTGSDYFTLTVRDHAFNANLGKAASQDDMSLQAIIPWGPKEAA
tara:strand:- start:1120 stop:1647 length:528 start_codon:yes stop_codon:yes gene_type:complete